MLTDLWNSITPDLRSFLIFAVIGVWNTALDFILWKLFLRTIKEGSKIDLYIRKLKLNRYSFCHSLAFIIANIVSYFLNKTFTFPGSQPKNIAISIGAFFAVSTFSLIISTLIINYLTSNKSILKLIEPFKPIASHWPEIAKITVVFVTMLTNFFGYKIFVF